MEFIRWCSILDRQNKRYLDKKLAPLGLNSSQHMYLIRVCREPGITQDSLFSRFYIHPSNITRALAALEQGGFLRKELHPQDRRTCRLCPTERGREVYQQILDICDSWEATVMEGLPQEERERLEKLLQRLGRRAVALLEQQEKERETT